MPRTILRLRLNYPNPSAALRRKEEKDKINNNMKFNIRGPYGYDGLQGPGVKLLVP